MDLKEKIKGLWKKAVDMTKKLGRRGATAICAVVLIACAVVLNVILFRGDDAKEELKPSGLAIDLNGIGDEVNNDDGADAAGANADTNNVGEYFASVSLGRQQARDEAMEVLLEVTENENAMADAKEAALKDINQIALDIEREGNIEAMVKAKGFEECVAVLSGDRANVIVKSDTLTPGETAQISEIVYEAAGILPENLKIIDKAAE